MTKIDTKAMMEGMRAQLESDQASGKLAGIDVSSLESAMSHPLAAEQVSELMARESSTVQQGQPAPDFTLPFLPGHGRTEGETLTLSERWAERPVALIFGSYT